MRKHNQQEHKISDASRRPGIADSGRPPLRPGRTKQLIRQAATQGYPARPVDNAVDPGARNTRLPQHGTGQRTRDGARRIGIATAFEHRCQGCLEITKVTEPLG